MTKIIKVSDILSEDSNLRDIVVTLPANIKWTDYQKELKEVEDYSSEMNFKVSILDPILSLGGRSPPMIRKMEKSYGIKLNGDCIFNILDKLCALNFIIKLNEIFFEFCFYKKFYFFT